MSNQLDTIRQLKEQGMSIREVAVQLSITKYEVEKAFQQLKAFGQRPDSRLDSYSDDRLDDESDSFNDESDDCPDDQDDQMPVSGEFALLSSAKGRSFGDLPSEWYKGVTRSDADFIIEHHIAGNGPSQIKACYTRKYPIEFISLEVIHQVVDAYENRVVRVRKQEEANQQERKAAAKKAADERMFEQFNNFVGEEALAFLLWFNEDEECEWSELKSCVTRASIILREIEDFCRKYDLRYQYYEPYTVIRGIKNAMDISLRRKKDAELSDGVVSFLGMINHRSSLDRYFWKMVDSSKSGSWC